ncbi:response regulator transcription factor [Olivibacter ginsenosidimutans]|uniref:Response regulator transcription factor n=1 Tax=Olivibacter ginsenosidimutans TaxID=1176537 RepID=A0ABP9BE36_9SPHI
MKISVAIADNNPIRRDGIGAILEQENLEVKHTEDCPDILKEHLQEVDVLIWGTSNNVPVDKNLITKLKVYSSKLKIIILDNDHGLQPAIKAIYAGAHGYITQSVQKEELLFAIKYVMQGKKYVDPSLTMRLFNKLSDFEDHIGNLNMNLTLSDKENEVLDLMVCGYANKEIAYRLFTTKRNIENLRQNLIEKTGAKDNLSLILYRLHKEFIQN